MQPLGIIAGCDEELAGDDRKNSLYCVQGCVCLRYENLKFSVADIDLPI